jgi:hypothetical protein
MTRDPITGSILPSEVIPISTWMRESSVFNVVSNMRFFRTYLPRKAFAAWRRAVRLKVYQAQRERLARRLFLARPTFCRPLVEVVGPELSALNKVEVQDFKSPKAFEMAVFAEKQAASTLAAAKRFESCMSLVTKALLNVCRSCKLRRQHFAQLRERDDDFDTKERNRHKSIVVMKEEKAERDRNERRAQMDFMSLGDLVRLVDYMAVNALVTVALGEQGKLECELRQPRIKQGLWETTVKFASREDMDAERAAGGVGRLMAGNGEDEEEKKKRLRRRRRRRRRKEKEKKQAALLEAARADGGEAALAAAAAAVEELELEDDDDDAAFDEDAAQGSGEDDDLGSAGSGSEDEGSDAEDGTTFITGMRFEPNRASTLDMVRHKNEGVIEMMDQVTRVCHVRRLRTHLRSSRRSAVGGRGGGGAVSSSGGMTDRFSTIQHQFGSGGTAGTTGSLLRVSQMGQQNVTVSSLIRSSPYYSDMCLAIDKRIKEDFRKAAEYAVQFEAVREIYDFRIEEYEKGLAEERRAAAQFKAQQEALHQVGQAQGGGGGGGGDSNAGSDAESDDLEGGGVGGADMDGSSSASGGGMDIANVGFAIEAAHIRSHMDNCETWAKRIERMRAHGTIGVLYVESRKLKNSLQPITKLFLDHLELELNELARERCKIALDEYKRRLAELDDRPPRLAEFADFVATTQRIEAERRRAFRETGVSDLHSVGDLSLEFGGGVCSSGRWEESCVWGRQGQRRPQQAAVLLYALF